MGGNAFADASTPRMPPAVYFDVKERLHKILLQHFERVCTPIGAAGKEDYGDVDFLLCHQLDEKTLYSKETLAKVIGAVDSKTAGPNSFNFLIPWPEDHENPSSETGMKKVHKIQIDVHICSDEEDFHWLNFLHSHGDFLNIMGHMLRKFDLTLTTKGLFLVVPELAGKHKTLARVFATNNPSIAMEFLGFKETGFWARYRTWDEFCGFIASSRFHDPGRRRDEYERQGLIATKDNANHISKATQNPEPKQAGSSRNGQISANVESIEEASAENIANGLNLLSLDLTKKDQKKFQKRPNVEYWHKVYRPAHVDDKPGYASHWTSAEVVEDAKRAFGPKIVKRYKLQKRQGLEFLFEQDLRRESRNYVNSNTSDNDGTPTIAVKGLFVLLKEDRSSEEAHNEPSWSDIEGYGLARASFQKLDLKGLMDWWHYSWKAVAARQRQLDEIKGYEAGSRREAVNGEALNGEPLKEKALKGEALNGEVSKGVVSKGVVSKEEVLQGEVLNGGVLKGETLKALKVR